MLTGLAMFLMLDSVCFGFLPSLFGGLLAAFNPWMYERVVSGHVAFAHGWVLILLLFALLRLRQERTLSRAAVAGGCYGLCFLMASYFGLLATALVIGFAIVDLFSVGFWAERIWTCSLLAVMSGVMFLALVPGVLALALDRDAVVGTLTRGLSQVDYFSASPTDYLLPAPNHPVVGGAVEDVRAEDPVREKTLFFGYVTILLAGATVFCLIRSGRQSGGSPRRELLWLSVAAGGVALLGSFGRKLNIGSAEIPLPGYLLAEVTTFYRVYARLGFVVGLALAILAAAALARISRRRYGVVAATAIVALVAMELAPTPSGAVRIDRAPAYDEWLADQRPGIVAHYPMMTDRAPAEQLAARELYYQRFTGTELFAMYGSAGRGKREDAIRWLARYVTDRRTPGILAAEGVRYVVVHDAVYRLQGEPIPRLGKEFAFVRRFGDVRVYRLRAKPADLDRVLDRFALTLGQVFGLEGPGLSFGSGFHAGEKYLDYQGTWHWMNQEGTLVFHNSSDKQIRARIEGLAFSHNVLRRIELVDPAGRIVARTLVNTFLDDFEIGPVELPTGRDPRQAAGGARAEPTRRGRSPKGEHLRLAPVGPAAHRLLDEPAPALR